MGMAQDPPPPNLPVAHGLCCSTQINTVSVSKVKCVLLGTEPKRLDSLDNRIWHWILGELLMFDLLPFEKKQ
jgi:hypothetical protein